MIIRGKTLRHEAARAGRGGARASTNGCTARTLTHVGGNCLPPVVVVKREGQSVEASDEELALAAARGEI